MPEMRLLQRQTEAKENEHAAVMEQILVFDMDQKSGIAHGGKCVVYFHSCTGVWIKMSNERVSRAAPQRIHSHTMSMHTCKHKTHKREL